MKKQLLIFVSIVFLALFANLSRVNAQCVGSGFSPSAGMPYTYDVTIPTGLGYTGGGTYNWYVTQNTDLIAGPILQVADGFFTVNTGPGLSTYNSTTGTTNQLGLTWTGTAVSSTTPFYLVLRYSETNGNANPGCSAENIRVWQINPINTFLLTFSGANSAGDSIGNANDCAAPLVSAVVSPATSSVEYTYGVNTLYYRVKASGTNGTWKPAIRIPALAGLGQNYQNVQWNDAINGTGTWHTFNVPLGSITGGDFVSTDFAPVTESGTPLLIRIQIANDNFETLANQGILVGIDGVTANNMPDIWGPGTWPPVPAPDPCDPAADFAKQATFTILARPTINPGATMPAFIQKLP